MSTKLEKIQIFLKSSFVVLSIIAILCGSVGALLSGMWDIKPPPKGIYSFGNYNDGIKWGAFIAAIGLIPYWIFHLLVGDARVSWKELKHRKLRVVWVICWALFLGWFFSRSLAV